MHVFDEEIACDVGMAAAVIYQNIYFWVEKNKANDKHKYDGTYWTYNSVKAFGELFPYMSSSQIRRALKTLEEKGYIITGNYNKVAYDRTTWYALTEKGFTKLDKSICSKRQMEVDEKTNRFVPNDKPIPDINTDVNTDVNTYKETQDKPAPSKKFVKPTISEIKEYAENNNLTLDAELFFDYYESKGWRIGNAAMKDWKATVRNWVRRSFDKGQGEKRENIQARSVLKDRLRLGE